MFSMMASSTPLESAPSASSSSSSPPSKAQLNALKAVHSSLVSGSKSNRKRKGVTVAKTFNMVGPYPIPRRTLTSQSIVATLEYVQTALTTSTVTGVSSSAFFALNLHDGYAQYTSLFDQYRFDRVECWLMPVAAQGTTVFGDLVVAVDLDDANASASRGDVSSKQQAIECNGGAGVYFSFAPHMAVAAYSGAFTSYSNVPAGFIDSASPGVQHFGLKMWAGQSAVAIPYGLRVRTTITFRAPGL